MKELIIIAVCFSGFIFYGLIKLFPISDEDIRKMFFSRQKKKNDSWD